MKVLGASISPSAPQNFLHFVVGKLSQPQWAWSPIPIGAIGARVQVAAYRRRRRTTGSRRRSAKKTPQTYAQPALFHFTRYKAILTVKKVEYMREVWVIYKKSI